ncbi:hypothetical protein HDE_13075 [Halotydeus destructor]|nr:hypothetical protein HDE_13075 [Halotydeus destructor]
MAPVSRSSAVYQLMLKQPAIRRKRKISGLIYAIVSFGFLGQVYNLLSLYLDYGVSYRTRYETPDHFTVPAVYICVQFEGVNNESMNDRIEAAPGASDLIESCRVFIKNDTFVDCDHVTRFRMYYDTAYVCVGMFETELMKVDVDILTHWSKELHLEPLFEIAIKANPKKSRKMKYIVGPNHGQLMVTRNSDAIVLCSSTVVSKMAVTFSRTYFSYLQAPYVSKCVDYEAARQASRNELLTRCIIDYSIYFPAKILTNPRDDIRNSRPLNKKITPEWLRVMLDCEAKYPMIECKHLDFNLDRKSVAYNENGKSSSVSFHLHHHSGDDMIIDEQPEMSLFYLGINMGGVLSLWLGLSVFGLQAKLIDMICDKYDERKFNENVFINLGKRHLLTNTISEKSKSQLVLSRTTIILISLLGCTMHCYHDIHRFIETPFVTESFIFKPKKVTLPSVTICVQANNQLESGAILLQSAEGGRTQRGNILDDQRLSRIFSAI